MVVKTRAQSPLVIKMLPSVNHPVVPDQFGPGAKVLRASEPASGSVRAKAEVHSPLAIRGRYRRFCSSVPSIRMPIDPMPLLVEIRVRKQALTLANSS